MYGAKEDLYLILKTLQFSMLTHETLDHLILRGSRFLALPVSHVDSHRWSVREKRKVGVPFDWEKKSLFFSLSIHTSIPTPFSCLPPSCQQALEDSNLPRKSEALILTGLVISCVRAVKATLEV